MTRPKTPLQQFFSPLKFVKVSFPGKLPLMMYLPLAVGLAAGIAFFYLPAANVAHDRGLLDVSAGLLAMLVGFFVAALGLALTLESPRLDEVPEHNAPTFGDRAITWREFARATTSYLVLVSLGAYLFATLALVLQPIAADLPDRLRHVARVSVGALYTFAFAHVISVTLLALFLMADKLPAAADNQKKLRPPARPGAPLAPGVGSSASTETEPTGRPEG